MKPFSLDHLNETEFEQFCYDLLQDLGFRELNWRKGTGLTSSPSDSGRDIECKLDRHGVDGEMITEPWFVECKHYQKGVPVDALTNALEWATAEKPDFLLIIVSNFLSNATKTYLEARKTKGNLPYKLMVWERPMLEKLASTRSKLLKKYALSEEHPFLGILHPAHIACLQDMPMSSFAHLIRCLEELPPQERDQMFGNCYYFILQPRFQEPVTDQENMHDLLIDPVDYPAFKRRCMDIIESGLISDYMLTQMIISFTLTTLFGVSDTTSIDKVTARFDRMIENTRYLIEQKHLEQEIEKKRIEKIEQFKRETPARIQRNYELYVSFCEQVLEKLRLEDFITAYREGLSPQKRQKYDDMVQLLVRKQIEQSDQ